MKKTAISLIMVFSIVFVLCSCTPKKYISDGDIIKAAEDYATDYVCKKYDVSEEDISFISNICNDTETQCDVMGMITVVINGRGVYMSNYDCIVCFDLEKGECNVAKFDMSELGKDY